ncbi:MAG TPA: hypothetical protein ENK55_06470, partial [Actinobacteria bacterium]|nr:hypothetical protein [Actinomycetota bacterium]
MTDATRRNVALNVVILLATLVVVSIVLVAGRENPEPMDTTLVVGQPSPETFVASRSTDPIEDQAATEANRQEARAAVPPVLVIDNEATFVAQREVASFFEDLEAVAFVEPVPPPPSSTTTEVPGGSAAGGDTAVDGEGQAPTTEPSTTTTTTIPRRPLDEQIAELHGDHPTLSRETIEAFVTLYNADLDRVAEGADPIFPKVEEKALELIRLEQEAGISQEELTRKRNQYLNAATRPP